MRARARTRRWGGPHLGLAIEELVDALAECRDVCWPARTTAGFSAV